MRPTIEQVLKAVETMGAPGMVKFFPCDALSRELIADELYCMMPSEEALKWLVSTIVRTVGEWQSLKEIRALLGTRYTPLDAARFPTPHCSIPGFTPDGSEQLYLAAEAEQSQRRIEGWKREAKLLPAAEQEANRKLLVAVAAAHCPRCRNSGLLETPGVVAPWQWCECEHGAHRREREPGVVDQSNAAVAKLWRLAGRSVPPPAAESVTRQLQGVDV